MRLKPFGRHVVKVRLLGRIRNPVGHFRSLSTVRQASGPLDIATFRRDAFEPAKPLLIRPSQVQKEDDETSPNSSNCLPALTKWFTTTTTTQGETITILSPYLKQYSAFNLPYELICPSPAENSSPNEYISPFLTWLSKKPSGPEPTIPHKALAAILIKNLNHLSHMSPTSLETPFLHFEAPLALFDAGLQFNNEQQHHSSPHSNTVPTHPPLQQLYIAQAPLNALPPPLQSDLPTLELVKTAGKGDVYNSSVWLGLAPTYTPWHRDPNPNLFCQMVGSKVVRLLPPRLGEHLFHRARAQLGQSTGGSSRIRGEEMMQGEERRVLLEAVWGDSEEGGGVPDEMREVILGPRDMLFIPKGWWHSVKSLGEDGRLNASVNWWFR